MLSYTLFHHEHIVTVTRQKTEGHERNYVKSNT